MLPPWSDYAGRWLFCILLAVFDALGLWRLGVTVDHEILRIVVLLDVGLLAVGFTFIAVGRKMGAARKASAAVAEFFCSGAQIAFFILAAGVASYLGAALNYSLIDTRLAQFDALFGFQHSLFDFFLVDHPQASAALFFAYSAMFPAFLFLLVVNAARGFGGNSDLLWGFFICALVTAAVAALLPAIGYDGMIGHRHIAILESVRAGRWIALGPSNADGIVTFPSFHAALAVIMAYDARRSKLTAAIVWPIAALIVISTPLCGGHYVADTIAGVAIAVAAVVVIRTARSERRTGWLSTMLGAALGSRPNAVPRTESTP